MAATVRLRTLGERSYAAAQWRFLNGGGKQPDHAAACNRVRDYWFGR